MWCSRLLSYPVEHRSYFPEWLYILPGSRSLSLSGLLTSFSMPQPHPPRFSVSYSLSRPSDTHLSVHITKTVRMNALYLWIKGTLGILFCVFLFWFHKRPDAFFREVSPVVPPLCWLPSKVVFREQFLSQGTFHRNCCASHLAFQVPELLFLRLSPLPIQRERTHTLSVWGNPVTHWIGFFCFCNFSKF